MFTFTVIIAVTVGAILAAIVALFSNKNKKHYFQRTFCYSSIAVAMLLILRILISTFIGN
ncbi:hypothetical protein SAMN05216262_11627 [Colwellia chukchiensis]|uniref:Uncharacterized protein n=2 Tax=Colwellia chukchiensis TaxID=641665 RepID=A0A1H7RWB6_9GAMM|nr:hypothetical protein SAMN05216262_11627 [Colwellia chukchiensis]